MSWGIVRPGYSHAGKTGTASRQPLAATRELTDRNGESRSALAAQTDVTDPTSAVR